MSRSADGKPSTTKLLNTPTAWVLSPNENLKVPLAASALPCPVAKTIFAPSSTVMFGKRLATAALAVSVNEKALSVQITPVGTVSLISAPAPGVVPVTSTTAPAPSLMLIKGPFGYDRAVPLFRYPAHSTCELLIPPPDPLIIEILQNVRLSACCGVESTLTSRMKPSASGTFRPFCERVVDGVKFQAFCEIDPSGSSICRYTVTVRLAIALNTSIWRNCVCVT